MSQINKAPPLVALVYRVGKGCRQYPFGTVKELAAWAARAPYKTEALMVIPVTLDRGFGEKRVMPASEAAAYVEAQLEPEVTQ